MKITEIRAVAVDIAPKPRTKPRVQKQAVPDLGGPMARYPELRRAEWMPGRRWKRTACLVTAEDGTFGLGLTLFSAPVTSLINDHLAELLTGQNPMATEKLWDMMQRATSPFGTAGLASFAISAVDNAIWDLKGKLLKKPVYELLGGPQKQKIFCYASNTDISYGTVNSIAWFLELGFKAVKLFLRYGPEEGVEGLRKNEEVVAKTREQIGPDVELMVDAWMGLNVEYAVRLVEALKPYQIKWLEDYLLPEDTDSYFRLRQRVPGQILATGEHWYTVHPFAFAATHGLVDIFQPDVQWAGGISAGLRIAHLAEAHGLTMIAHAGMNYPYGQHLTFAMPAVTWGERSEGVSPPGVPLEEMVALPGTPAIKGGYLVPSDAPGFGLEITKAWLEDGANR
jgi:L-rhamnonate dehydratase